jgi:diguanylate cyclase (GGDEF)-like protein
MGLISFTLILEIFSVVLNNPNLKQFIIFNKLVNVFGFLVTPIIPFMGYIFCREWANRYKKEKIKVNSMHLIPLFINGIAALMSYNGNILFHITSENVYERGPLFFILPCVCYIYIGCNLYYIYKERKKFAYSELVIFSSFYIVPAVFTIIQLKYSAYLTIWNSTAIVIVITYIFILNDHVHRDSLTGLENRLSYEHFAQNVSHKKINKLFIVYVDIDDFKSINDKYGHFEGDEAIKAFANLLVESFPIRQKKLIRLGGDEFLILLEERQREKVADYIQNLIQHVEEYNNSGEKRYKLRFSYGMAGYSNEYNSVNQLLESADQLMYEQKQL